ncbi:hypothetical protein HNQ02_003155 [Flavobacterium sp. 7E]|nr:hypothetical protein [Flavobacterium sp. 7E]NRS90218.1 hypothetical protein [Flavobacterium sp. 7E]
MIDIKYKLTEEDILELNLYHFDVEKSFKKNSEKIIFLFLIIISVLIVIFIYQEQNFNAIMLALIAFFILIFHKQIMRNKYK